MSGDDTVAQPHRRRPSPRRRRTQTENRGPAECHCRARPGHSFTLNLLSAFSYNLHGLTIKKPLCNGIVRVQHIFTGRKKQKNKTIFSVCKYFMYTYNVGIQYWNGETKISKRKDTHCVLSPFFFLWLRRIFECFLWLRGDTFSAFFCR